MVLALSLISIAPSPIKSTKIVTSLSSYFSTILGFAANSYKT
jgi:hypothetical protein